MGDADRVQEGYQAFKAATNPGELYDYLDQDVILFDYDNKEFRNGRVEVADYLIHTLQTEAFPDPPRWPPVFTYADGAVLCLNEMMDTDTGKRHACLDIVKVRDAKVTEIRCCVVQQYFDAAVAASDGSSGA